MNELQAILKTWRGLEGSNRDAVLATVVHVKGSAYRRPGARMLILPDGRRIGTISGGCLEGDVSRKAWWFTEGGKPSVRVYDTSSDEDAVWEFGLGCNGVIQVMLERVSSDSAEAALTFLDGCLASRISDVMATVIRTSPDSAWEVGERVFGHEDTPLGGVLRPYIEAAESERKSRLVYLHDCEVFVEYIAPPVPLVVFGAGHDAIPVVSLAKQLGWHVTVADGRPAYATTERFPEADRVVVMNGDNLLRDIEINGETVVVLMTHNYPQDGKLLRGILPSRPRYLGMLGPKKRAAGLFAEIGASPEMLDVHAPVGLDIGADTPEAIALSIVSEIQASLKSRPGMMLRHRRGPIHEAAQEAGVRGLTPEPLPDAVTCEIR